MRDEPAGVSALPVQGGPARILAVRLRYEHDVVAARQRAREVAEALGFDAQEQTRIATALSEIARNAFTYAGGGKVEFLVEGRTPPQILVIHVSDDGPGIADLEGILAGRYRSRSGLGLGILGARRLMDQFHVESVPGRGTSVTLKKLLPAGAPMLDARRLAGTVDELARRQPPTPFGELQQQNQELLRTLEELRQRQEELGRLNAELEDTNRGVVALYAELDEKADHLRRADEMKSRFLSNMSHEFRTPLNSMLALTRLILGRSDGPLTAEQEKQVSYIRKAAEDLSELVNDLLDLAKVEAGKIVVRPVEFEVGGLFGALRGMLRPLLVNEAVNLVFEEPQGIPPLYNDEGKVSQILRNFISNALKFTERGEVRVSATPAPDGESVVFSVADTGIGIAPEDQERIFQEFAQVDNPVQRKVRGTGLGLPLSRRLAELLGGRLTVESQPGGGSTFSATIPLVYAPAPPPPAVLAPDWRPDAARRAVLVVENSAETILLYEKYLKRSPYEVVPVRRLRDARALLRRVQPAAILLDILLDGEDAWAFLAELKREEATRTIPVVVLTSVEDERKAIGLGADAYAAKPIERRWLVETLGRLTREAPGHGILVIDDAEADRYVLRAHLGGLTDRAILEAASGEEGLARARAARPAAIVLDLVMPGMSGEEVLDALEADEATRSIPVIVATSSVLDPARREALAARTAGVVSKASLSREGPRGLEEALARAGLAPGAGSASRGRQ
jgi:signal transduction histidine kinase/DNA-binding response OmpR family regulator